MSGFSPEWLALREPVDHRARHATLAAKLQARFASAKRISIVDLGCGAGSNLRGTYSLLPAEQNWTLVDYDPRLLAAARARTAAWSDTCEHTGDALRAVKDGKRLCVRFKQADLNADLDGALGAAPDLVTAAAFFDLCSEAFIRRLAEAVAARKATFYTVLTYNGRQSWTPAHNADALLLDGFRQHQLGDKGFGPSAGWRAPEVLRAAFASLGHSVAAGDSPWRLDATHSQLIADLAKGFAGAVRELGTVHADTLASWQSVTRTAALVGHTDTLAWPT